LWEKGEQVMRTSGGGGRLPVNTEMSLLLIQGEGRQATTTFKRMYLNCSPVSGRKFKWTT
jgi:hypothetical protein